MVVHNPRRRRFEAFPDYQVTADLVDHAYGHWADAKGNGVIANKRAHARRAIIMKHKGGRCAVPNCEHIINDYRFITFYHLDHVYDIKTYPTHPNTGKRQFHISGNDCSNRQLEEVVRHALSDTTLLCRDHHHARTVMLERRRREHIAQTETFNDLRGEYLNL